MTKHVDTSRGVGRGGPGAMPPPPHKIWTGGEKGPHFLALFGLYAINQYFLVTLFPHRVNLPAHSNFTIRLHTVITTYCSVKKLTLETFNDVSQLIVYCAVMPSALQLDYI